jgi:hypothetical protein
VRIGKVDIMIDDEAHSYYSSTVSILSQKTTLISHDFKYICNKIKFCFLKNNNKKNFNGHVIVGNIQN